MKRATWFALLLVPALAACGGSTDNVTPAGSGGGATTSAVAGPSSGAGPTSTSTGAGGGNSDDTVTLKMTSFVVPMGKEVYKCQNFANPFGAKDVDVSEFESHMAVGSHHMLMFYMPPQKGVPLVDAPLEDCLGTEFHATPYSTQLPDDSLVFPAGVAAVVPGDNGIRLQSHYLNTTGADITANVTLTFHLAKDGTVTSHAGVLFVVDLNIDVGPNSTKVEKYDCNLPYDMKLLKATSHMHKHGTNFTSTIAGEPIFDTKAWSDPKPTYFDPAKQVHAGDPLHFECTFVNNSASTLIFGESALTNEMCIFGASYYPIPEGGDVTVGCQ